MIIEAREAVPFLFSYRLSETSSGAVSNRMWEGHGVDHWIMLVLVRLPHA
jgi:hypothetical protein